MGNKSFQRRLLGGAAAVAALAACGAAHAEDLTFNIAPQPLASALNQFGAQSDTAVLVRPDLAGAKMTKGVSGAASAEIALNTLLEGTGLTYRREGDTFLIVSASDPQSGSAAGDGAEGTVQALVVTAQKREEDIQDVPIAISAFTQEDLTRSQVAGGPDLMTQVPNFTFTKTNFSGYSIQIRGIGTQAISATTDPAVAVAFNNTPFIRNRFFEQEFYDLERVEVLRGPQGTLYGRNATAGVVNIISAKPKHRFEAKISADVANYNSTRLEGMLNLPLFEDKLALRIAGAWTKRDGFVKNTLTGDQIDGRDLWSTRVTLGLEPTDHFSANLIWEHFEEHDDRLRSGKQLCRKDSGPTEINGTPIYPSFSYPLYSNLLGYFTQGCLPASLYSPDSFQTPNGFALPYGPAAQLIGSPVADVDTYESAFQSRNLREIETRIKPEYTAANDTVELQFRFDLPHSLTLASETGFSKDHLFSFEDYNRFSTRPHTITNEAGFICNPQIGCSDREQAGDLSEARSQHFSQEFRLSSNYEGRFNFNLGANFLRYDTEDKYYVFINTLSGVGPQLDWCDDVGQVNNGCLDQLRQGYEWSNPNKGYGIGGIYIDPNDIHHLNDLGRNYFLSKNPYGLKSYAVFGEAYYNIADNLKLTAGLRWTVDRKVAPQIPSWLLASTTYGIPTRKTIRQEWREPTGRIAIDWKPHLSFTDETLIYGSYVRGYKAGGANPPPAILVFAPVSCAVCDEQSEVAESLTHPESFKPEFVDAYEAGTKNTVLGGRLTFNLNAFYYDYTGYQISQIVDRSAVNLNFDAKIWGSELEVDWRPAENLRLGFKGGYENTRMADGSQAIDLMDRTAGMPGWILHKPFPTFPSSCIVPIEYAFWENRGPLLCSLYKVNQAHPGTLPWDAPNNGEGFAKDLSGNSLPNAPHFTATITADYTLPLRSDWLMTLHTDLYHQSEAWTRIFNTPGYDKLKAYNNINIAAIFSNEDAGWQVMAYVKNVLDKDNITGAFLNSDDTGLTTNVFLNEPRLFGLRVTRNWTGSDWWSAHANRSGHYPYRLEFDGDYGRTSGGREILVPAGVAYFPSDHPYPLGVQNNLDWGSGGGVKFIYQPQPQSWSLSGSVRYGRARGGAEEHPEWAPKGGYVANEKYTAALRDRLPPEQQHYLYLDPASKGLFNYATTTGRNEESHTIVDFAVGKDLGLGAWRDSMSHFDVGLRYANFRSTSNTEMHGRPDISFPSYGIVKYGGSWHRFWTSMDTQREFKGAGPAASWEQGFKVLGEADQSGRVDADIGLGGSFLFGRQTANVSGNLRGDYHTGYLRSKYPQLQESGSYNTPFAYRRSHSATVPSINANLGLSYTLGGMKLSGGYRIERYYKAIDGGISKRKTYDRQLDGPYLKMSIGFGG
jgi:iron complex outermembrane receptor protein